MRIFPALLHPSLLLLVNEFLLAYIGLSACLLNIVKSSVDNQQVFFEL